MERLDDGEVSPYLDRGARVGDQLELRGPIGGYFVWDASDGGPSCCSRGGSGVVPLMAMLRHRAGRADQRARRGSSIRHAAADIIYREELDRLAGRGDGSRSSSR